MYQTEEIEAVVLRAGMSCSAKQNVGRWSFDAHYQRSCLEPDGSHVNQLAAHANDSLVVEKRNEHVSYVH